MRRRLRHVAIAAVVAAASVASCGGSDSSGDEPSADTDATVVDDPGSDETTGGGTSGDSGDSTVLTGEQICERLTIASLAADVGLDIVAAEPDDDATPQCAYEYLDDSGGRSNLTVAAMRPADVGGATGSDAFDVVVGVNLSIAGEGAEQQDIDAGDEAMRISGAALHLGIVRIGDHVYTLIVPADDAGIDAVDRLIGTMATTLG